MFAGLSPSDRFASCCAGAVRVIRNICAAHGAISKKGMIVIMSFANGAERLKSEVAALSESKARKRLESLFDNGSFTELERFVKNGGDSCGVICAYGYVSGSPAYAFSQDTTVSGGAMGKVQSAKISRLFEKAGETGLPVFAIYDSNGAYVGEGVGALSAYGDLIKASNNLSGVVPQISLVLGSCIGSAAVLAGAADVVIMSADAEMYVTSGNILGNKTVGSAELAAKNGTAHIVAENEDEAIAKAKEIITLLPVNNLSVAPAADYIPAEGGVAAAGADTMTVISSVIDGGSAVELCADFAPCVYTALCRIGGNAVGVVATANAENEGRICASGCSKAARFVRMCDAFTIPVVTFVDTMGFLITAESELSGGVKAMTTLTHAFAEATTPKVALITGNAVGAGYTALAGRASGTDMTLAFPNAVVSALEPLTAVSVLYADRIAKGETREQLAEEYVKTDASVFVAAADGYIDDIIDPAEAMAKITAALEMLSGKRVSTLDKKHSNMPL